jgi:hypothetical protein
MSTAMKRVTNTGYIGFLGKDQGYPKGEYWQIGLECGHSYMRPKKDSKAKQLNCPRCAKE